MDGAVAATIHPTAIVDASVVVEAGATIGPYCVVEADVSIGAGSVLEAHVALGRGARIGAGVRMSPFASVGGPPQDLSYRDEPTHVEVGDRTVIREHVTIHRGTARGVGVTRVGTDCYLMAGAHVAHDCQLGNGVIVSNNVLMGGHTVIGDFVTIGGAAAIRQRLRIGTLAFVSGIAGLAKDVIPFGYVIGYRGRLDGLNLVGLKRRGVERVQIHRLLKTYRRLFSDEGTFQERLDQVAATAEGDPLVGEILAFIEAGKGRPLLTPFEQDDI